MKKCLVVIFLLISTNSAFSKDTFNLSIESMVNEAKKNPPTVDKIRLSLLSSKLNKSEYLENFDPKLTGDISYFETNEQPFIEFAPTVSPTTNMSLGITKDFTSGVSLGLTNTFERNKFESFGTDARNTVSLELTVDLYKDFFGRDSKTRISYFEHEEQIAEIQKDIDVEVFLVSLARIYLSLVYNQEAINVSRDILEIYKKQAADADKRYKNGITDLSEVKRRSSQVASKRVEIFDLVNKKENLILDLKQLLPSVSNKEVMLAKYDVKELEGFFAQIIRDIYKKKKAPLEYTKYDEVVSLLEKSYEKQKKFTKHYNDVDVEFYSKYNHFGRDNDYSHSFDNTYEDPDESYQVGLRLSAPIGKSTRVSEQLQLHINKANFLAKKKENLAKIESYHTQSLKNLEILKKANKYQSKNSKDLNKILKLSQRKYKQARIPIRDLISDQDFYLQSLLREINIKMVIANQIFDYMTVFTNTPFAFSNNG